MTATAVADPKARGFLRNADPVLARLIEAHPDFHPCAWIDELQGRTSSELVADLVAGARVVKAANTLSAEVLSSDPHEAGGQLHLRRRRRRESGGQASPPSTAAT